MQSHIDAEVVKVLRDVYDLAKPCLR
ncbi:hypothetical protein SOVF_209300, partial [Spinacia oleracea]